MGAGTAGPGGGQRLCAGARLSRHHQAAAEAAGALAGDRDRGGDQGLRRHRTGDGEAAGAGGGAGLAGEAHQPPVARTGELVLPRGDLHRGGAAAGCGGGGPLRVVPGLPRRLPDRGVPRALPSRCPTLHQLPHDRARRAGRGRAAAADGQPDLRLRRLPRGLSVEQVRGGGARDRLCRARGAGGAAAGGAGGARRCRVPRDVPRLGGEADRTQPLPAQRRLCDRQFRGSRPAAGGRAAGGGGRSGGAGRRGLGGGAARERSGRPATGPAARRSVSAPAADG